jgi:hypothetical protein
MLANADILLTKAKQAMERVQQEYDRQIGLGWLNDIFVAVSHEVCVITIYRNLPIDLWDQFSIWLLDYSEQVLPEHVANIYHVANLQFSHIG